MTTEKMKKLEAVADHIAAECKALHDPDAFGTKPGNWNPLFGQYLVYGFERAIGFADAVELEAEIERAYLAKKDIKLTALHFFVKRAIE